MTDEKNNTPVIRVALQIGIGEARALTFETYVASTSDAKFICALLDKLNFCGDRSKAVYDVEALENQLKKETHLLGAMQDNLVMIDNQIAERKVGNLKRGSNPTTPQEAKVRSDVERQIKDRGEHLKRLREEIDEKRSLIKQGDIDGNSASPANS